MNICQGKGSRENSIWL